MEVLRPPLEGKLQIRDSKGGFECNLRQSQMSSRAGSQRATAGADFMGVGTSKNRPINHNVTRSGQEKHTCLSSSGQRIKVALC